MGSRSPTDMMATASVSIQQRTGKTLDEWVAAVLKSRLALWIRTAYANSRKLKDLLRIAYEQN
ncbi:MAG: hypothetical protein WBI14_01000 [Anaerolineaceae bacterium]